MNSISPPLMKHQILKLIKKVPFNKNLREMGEESTLLPIVERNYFLLKKSLCDTYIDSYNVCFSH